MIDARGRGGRTAAAGVGGLGIGGVLIVLLLSALSGGQFDINSALNETGYAIDAGSQPLEANPAEDSRAEFSNAVAVNVQDVWTDIFRQAGEPYDRTKVVRFSRAVSTGCGAASKDVGPFYCPADKYVYLDMSFYEDMRRELQADCYAGVWARAAYGQGALEPGDLDEALGAAEAVGDDSIQSRSRGGVQPDTFTHGTAEQRRTWFSAGYDSGSPGACDTFSPDRV